MYTISEASLLLSIIIMYLWMLKKNPNPSERDNETLTLITFYIYVVMFSQDPTLSLQGRPKKKYRDNSFQG